MVIVSGLVSGVLTSLALRAHLAKARKRMTVVVGAVSLPFGAFLFGFLLSVLQWVFLARDFSPFSVGFQYALFSMISIFAIVLFPLAILTTFLLRAVIVSRSNHEKAA